MNQIKIGKFIAESRKKQNLTQLQLAEKLGITDKAISKWERGIALPDTSIMLELCSILNVSVNELLLGEKNVENENKQNDNLLIEMAKTIEQKNKAIMRATWSTLIISSVAYAAIILISIFLIQSETWQLITIGAGTLLFVAAALYVLKLEVSVGYYKCKKYHN